MHGIRSVKVLKTFGVTVRMQYQFILFHADGRLMECSDELCTHINIENYIKITPSITNKATNEQTNREPTNSAEHSSH
jgi:hypothetical protein